LLDLGCSGNGVRGLERRSEVLCIETIAEALCPRADIRPETTRCLSWVRAKGLCRAISAVPEGTRIPAYPRLCALYRLTSPCAWDA
jgi:hypothetical protein